ncbi:carbohydrate kinase family protein [Candidatus Woesebacteria bacterium]|nr:carbohydrate kinase family protein [Candidatus Woesebacteria bacterium]QQG47586.1 MAG: carbohydrate kinase family protein [Candidatus Woesebacteria bacterium]
MNDKFDLISIGDASLDTFLTPTDTETQCKLDTKECLICFPYGDKIPVSELEFTTGGNAANNAVGASRFGVATAIVLTVGGDRVAKQVVETLVSEKVETKYISYDEKGRSNYSTVINYSGERTIFVYHAPRNYVFPSSLPSASWTYLTSMGESFEPFYKSVYEWISKNPEMRLAFNPGSWQFKKGLPSISHILSITDVIFVNREEAEKLTNLSKSSYKNDRELLEALGKLGPKMSVITDGGSGAFCFDGRKYLRAGVLPIDPYERTGAGDAFGSGFLSAVIKGKDFSEALLWGTSNSSSVIGYTGPQKGLLRESEIDSWLDRCKSSGVTVTEF